MTTSIIKQKTDQNSKRLLRSRLGRIVAVLLILLLFGIAGFIGWAEFPPAPMPEAIAALTSSPSVKVESQHWFEFTPVNKQPTTGFIFYPGGHVDSRAYAPALHKIAEAGYYAVIVPMQLNLAVLSPNRANDVIAAHPEIQNWVIGGHSLGGTMAANYVFTHPEAVQGLVLWASYPQASNSLAGNGQLQAASVYGTSDGLVTQANIQESIAHLPATTDFVAIEGGNHGQFGWYGEQSGDNPATIGRDEQMSQAVAATIKVLQSVEK